MSQSKQRKKGAYRRNAFFHWLNLTFLAVGGAAAVMVDPSIWLALVPLELGAMWVVPDLPWFRLSVDKKLSADELYQEREYYMQQLWGLAPEEKGGFGSWLKRLVAEPERQPLENRVLNRNDPAFHEYLEILQAVAKLRELEQLRKITLRKRNDIDPFALVLNGYLRFVMGHRALARVINRSDPKRLKQQVAQTERELEQASSSLRAVLQQRLKMQQSQLERLPKVQAMCELFRTRADAVLYQLRNIVGQLMADPGADINLMLDEIVERQELMADPLGDLEADHMLDHLLASTQFQGTVNQPEAGMKQDIG